MRLLTLATDPNAGGSAISLLNLLKGLKDEKIECLVVVQKEGFLTDKLHLLGIDYAVIPSLRLTIWPHCTSFRHCLQFPLKLIRWRLGDLIAKYKLNRICKKFNPDILHTNVSLCSIGYSVALRNKLPHVWHIREYGDLDFGVKFFPSDNKRIQLLKTNNCISITEGIKQYYGLKDNCTVIYNGICSSKDIIIKTPKQKYFLFVGHVNEEKGVTDLIKAFIKYKCQGGNYKLLIAGTYADYYQKHLLRLLEPRSLISSVTFLGQCDNVYSFMQSAAALIVPSKYEAFGRVTAEAMFNGCIVIGRNTGGTKEQLQLGLSIMGAEVGLLFNSIDEMVEKLFEVEKMSLSQINTLITRAQDFAISQFSNEKNIKSTKQYLESLVGNNVKGGAK